MKELIKKNKAQKKSQQIKLFFNDLPNFVSFSNNFVLDI